MQTSLSITSIIKAIIAAKQVMEKPSKDGVNPHFRSKYTTLDELLRCVETAIATQGLLMTKELLNGEGTVGCRITVYHSSGEWMQSEDFYVPTQQTAQGHGSAATYVLRYCIAAFWGLPAEDDDDGNNAMPNKKSNSTPVRPNPKSKALESIVALVKEKQIPLDQVKEIISTEFKKNEAKELTLDECKLLYKKLSG